jgi:hypothetical protein
MVFVVAVRGALAAGAARGVGVCQEVLALMLLREGALVCVGTHSRGASSYHEILEVKLRSVVRQTVCVCRTEE